MRNRLINCNALLQANMIGSASREEPQRQISLAKWATKRLMDLEIQKLYKHIKQSYIAR